MPQICIVGSVQEIWTGDQAVAARRLSVIRSKTQREEGTGGSSLMREITSQAAIVADRCGVAFDQCLYDPDFDGAGRRLIGTLFSATVWASVCRRVRCHIGQAPVRQRDRMQRFRR